MTNVKNIKQAANEAPDIASKLQHIELTVGSCDEQGRYIQKSLVFKDIMGYQVGSQWVQVAEKDGTSFVYPASQVEFIKSYFTE